MPIINPARLKRKLSTPLFSREKKPRPAVVDKNPPVSSVDLRQRVGFSEHVTNDVSHALHALKLSHWKSGVAMQIGIIKREAAVKELAIATGKQMFYAFDSLQTNHDSILTSDRIRAGAAKYTALPKIPGAECRDHWPVIGAPQPNDIMRPDFPGNTMVAYVYDTTESAAHLISLDQNMFVGTVVVAHKLVIIGWMNSTGRYCRVLSYTTNGEIAVEVAS